MKIPLGKFLSSKRELLAIQIICMMVYSYAIEECLLWICFSQVYIFSSYHKKFRIFDVAMNTISKMMFAVFGLKSFVRGVIWPATRMDEIDCVFRLNILFITRFYHKIVQIYNVTSYIFVDSRTPDTYRMDLALRWLRIECKLQRTWAAFLSTANLKHSTVHVLYCFQ